MYIFRIISPIDKTKTWYKGEFIDASVLSDVSVTNPLGYPLSGSTAEHTGDSVEYEGYIYTSLKDSNTDIPKTNYLGYPLTATKDTDTLGKNSWVRSSYANRMMMLVPESCGITESYGADITGTIGIPSGIPYIDIDKCSCVLFCGVLGKSITVNAETLNDIDVNDYESGIGNPEISGLNKAFTMSNRILAASTSFGFSIIKSDDSVSTYCSGGYLGSWSYLGITQWTDHKKSTNDYSRQDQDEWGSYELSKNRTGRTYSADVILTPRIGAVDGDYDYNLNDLCFSVAALLQSQLGTVNAFYFNNQDIGVPWIPVNTDKHDQLIELVDSDIIVGIITDFKISEVQGNRAILSLTVQSVPNEYKNYQAASDVQPITAPPVPGIISCTSISLSSDTVSVTVGATDNTVLINVEPVDGNFTHGNPIVANGTIASADISLVGSTYRLLITGIAGGTTTVKIGIGYWSINNKIEEIELTLEVNVTE